MHRKSSTIPSSILTGQKLPSVTSRCLAHTPQLGINDAFEVLQEELDALAAVTSHTRSSTITVQNFAKFQQTIIDEVKSGKPPPEQPPPLFVYPLRLNRDVALKLNTWDKPKKHRIIGATRWNNKKYGIDRSFQIRVPTQRYLAEKCPQLLQPYVEAMGTLFVIFIRRELKCLSQDS